MEQDRHTKEQSNHSLYAIALCMIRSPKKIATIAALILMSFFLHLSVSELASRGDHEMCIDDGDEILLRSKRNGRIDNLDELILAIIHIESGGDPFAIGDSHMGAPSVGCMQIRPIMVREVNAITEKSGSNMKWVMRDRQSRDKSIAIFQTWVRAHHKNSSFEKIARNWNGGPQGYKKPSTEGYWTKIETYAKANL